MVKEKLLARDSRIINVSCHAYLSAKMTIDDPLNMGKWAPVFHARDAFAHSKLAIVMTSRELSEVLKGEYMFLVSPMIERINDVCVYANVFIPLNYDVKRVIVHINI